jgi:hypothetical protein
MDNKTTNINKRGAIMWNTTIFMIIFHAGAVASVLIISLKVITIKHQLWWISGSLGFGMVFKPLG